MTVSSLLLYGRSSISQRKSRWEPLTQLPPEVLFLSFFFLGLEVGLERRPDVRIKTERHGGVEVGVEEVLSGGRLDEVDVRVERPDLRGVQAAVRARGRPERVDQHERRAADRVLRALVRDARVDDARVVGRPGVGAV